jgi:hypothetical protein
MGEQRNEDRLLAAGYRLDGDGEVWRHPTTNRMLAADMARLLTEAQLTAWIADGDARSG